LLRPVDRAQRDVGMSRAAVVVGVDLGGTRLRAGAAPANAETPASADVSELLDGPAPASVDDLVAALDAAVSAASAIGPVAGIGVTVPGLVTATTCRWVPNLSHLEGVDLAALHPSVIAAGND